MVVQVVWAIFGGRILEGAFWRARFGGRIYGRFGMGGLWALLGVPGQWPQGC